jgi:hypothetical protein
LLCRNRDELVDVVVAIALGLGLAAAAGLRVFVPILGAGVAAHLGYVQLGDSFTWMSSWPALISFGTATVLEILAFYIPWVDHALDAVATPAAVGAGMLASASVLVDFPPALRWGIAVIGGGGIAGTVQALTVGARIKSTTLTGGLANAVVATFEAVGAVGLVILAIALPVVALACVIALCLLVYRIVGRLTWRRGRVART